MQKLTKQPKSILRMKVRGAHIKPGRIPIPELLIICDQAQKAVNRQAEVLRGKKGLRPGPTATVVKEECTLELFKIGRGSAQISFAAPDPPAHPQGVLDIDIEHLGEAAVREVVRSLRGAQRGKGTTMDPGVRRSFQEMGEILANGVSSIDFFVPGQRGKRGQASVSAKFDHHVWERINEKKNTTTTDVTLDGRLEAADFLLEDLKCVLHVADGQRITCSFAQENEDAIYKALRHITRITGAATINSKTRRIEHIALATVAVLDPFLAPTDDFFSNRSIQQLTESQGTDPAFDLRTLEHGWPADDDVDAFLAAIEQHRQ